MLNEVEKKVRVIKIFHFNAIVLRDEESLQLLSYAKQCFLPFPLWLFTVMQITCTHPVQTHTVISSPTNPDTMWGYGEGSVTAGREEGDDEWPPSRNSTATHNCRTRKTVSEGALTSCWLVPFRLICYFWTYPYHLSASTPLIPHSIWTSSDIHTDMQCLISSTITSPENVLVTPFLSHTVQYHPCFLLDFTKQTNKPKHGLSTQTTFRGKVEWIPLLINSFTKK